MEKLKTIHFLVMLAYVGKVAQTVISVKIVGPIPAIAMSFVRMFPTPATIALGGVPTLRTSIQSTNFRFEKKGNSYRHMKGKTATESSRIHE